jgi:hypothetical protein
MKLQDIEQVNHLVAELDAVKGLIAHTGNADAADCELFIKLPGDSSIRMSLEGAASTHYVGFSASAAFLQRLKQLAIEELEAKRRSIIADLAALGVEAGA